ncbi:GNAT family N-acetyltransferase [Meiothermus sp. QL-1]|uniref:GNAT family N-acetyltransferase n=1 Tax=Meiothermus sp. QL-1 TaxID=2058095 RepID=UPI000E0C8C74|nr:GNAT family N-acetyltransferase [Meiothermus sp. QL-1]RDI94538.1 GNAT family N-acetyltransferase [Meiothermus sp. QL-1]
MEWPEIDEHFVAAQAPPQAMDLLWAGGWRHFGTHFFRYSRLGEQRVIPLRVRLARFALRKSQQRVLKRNRDLEVRIGPAFANPEVEALFHRHKLRFKQNVPRSLYQFISPTPDRIPCRCHSLALYQGPRLVGISYLDEGEEAASSVYQCFEPALARRSLGILMLLLSIEQALEWGKRFYYPGYAYQAPSFYDYKKRLLGLEFYDWRAWHPFEAL